MSAVAKAGAKAVGKIAKPDLRGLFHKDMRVHFAAAFSIATVATYIYKVTMFDHRQKVFAEYFKNLDVKKDFERKMKAGVFQCVDSNGVIRPIE